MTEFDQLPDLTDTQLLNGLAPGAMGFAGQSLFLGAVDAAQAPLDLSLRAGHGHCPLVIEVDDAPFDQVVQVDLTVASSFHLALCLLWDLGSTESLVGATPYRVLTDRYNGDIATLSPIADLGLSPGEVALAPHAVALGAHSGRGQPCVVLITRTAEGGYGLHVDGHGGPVRAQLNTEQTATLLKAMGLLVKGLPLRGFHEAE